jgi:hypothetical protein
LKPNFKKRKKNDHNVAQIEYLTASLGFPRNDKCESSTRLAEKSDETTVCPNQSEKNPINVSGVPSATIAVPLPTISTLPLTAIDATSGPYRPAEFPRKRQLEMLRNVSGHSLNSAKNAPPALFAKLSQNEQDSIVTLG